MSQPQRIPKAPRDADTGLLVSLPLHGGVNDCRPAVLEVDATGVNPARDRFGVEGKAVFFAGRHTAVSFRDHPLLHPRVLTIALWMSIAEDAEDQLARTPLVDRMNPFVADGYRLHAGPMGISGAVATRLGAVENAEHLIQLAPGRWYHLAMTFDTHAIRFYLDGSPLSSHPVAVAGTIIYGEMPTRLGIGSRVTGVTSHHIGRISDLALYDGALTPTEIRSLVR
ncbi:MAG: LamG domain-containing protein [Gemmatimonadaceae bacterium]|nr:LamG domain-containing protein [Gemmatimonadaceae bacterium]